MKTYHFIVVALGLLTAGCQSGSEPSTSPSSDASATAAATGAAAVQSWPASLTIVGSGFPNAGDACRVIGETAATVDFLDDSATLVGCLDAADAAKLGGKQVGVVDGVTLVSVPANHAAGGDGDGQGDAKVAGTDYNATAQIRCSGVKGAAGGTCEAGVKRDGETGAVVEVTLPGGGQRVILFDKKGKFLTFSTAQADGTAAMKISSGRDGDTTIATLGSERYEIPDVFVQGD
ncbi:hypothetical protein [Novosphingobium sp. FKTRR1]|uniref:hypothetical protein n=1 Tax=Novosphingobium sp. FKTRR1 TaxID=2879118 RepID=UPI001CEFEDDC|nr:hypothetical protein [Novosphingobium sp. FKTRR1]